MKILRFLFCLFVRVFYRLCIFYSVVYFLFMRQSTILGNSDTCLLVWVLQMQTPLSPLSSYTWRGAIQMSDMNELSPLLLYSVISTIIMCLIIIINCTSIIYLYDRFLRFIISRQHRTHWHLRGFHTSNSSHLQSDADWVEDGTLQSSGCIAVLPCMSHRMSSSTAFCVSICSNDQFFYSVHDVVMSEVDCVVPAVNCCRPWQTYQLIIGLYVVEYIAPMFHVERRGSAHFLHSSLKPAMDESHGPEEWRPAHSRTCN